MRIYICIHEVYREYVHICAKAHTCICVHARSTPLFLYSASTLPLLTLYPPSACLATLLMRDLAVVFVPNAVQLTLLEMTLFPRKKASDTERV